MATATAPTTGFKYRDYQLNAVKELHTAVKRHGSAVYVLPTGGGKTVVAGLIADGATRHNNQIMLVVHRRELVKQSLATLSEAVPGLTIGVEAPGWPSIPWAPLQIGMVQSMVRRPSVQKMRPKVVIWDEAHHIRAGTWEKAISWWPNAAHVGMTATPERLDGKGLGTHFGTMVLGPTIKQLVARGDLVAPRTLTIPIDIDLRGLRRNKRGEYGADIGKRITDKVVADAADAYMRYAGGKRAIFFGENIDHSKRVIARLRSLGVRAEHVDGNDTTNRRDLVMGAFKDGIVEVVGNCDLISEGFDAPGCEAVILGKYTKSVTRYLQWTGRALRPAYLKLEALVLDLTGISYELGLPDEDREWSLADGELQEKRDRESRPRACERCKTTFYGRRCPQCAYQPPLDEVEEEQVELIAAKGRRNGGRGGRRSEVWAELARAYRQPNVVEAVRAIGRRRGYKPGWAERILQAKGYR